MATNQLSRAVRVLRPAAIVDEGTALTDAQLLERYVRSRDEPAFAGLVHRHGPMVWGVCRRVLSSHQDAEDAFQATFLVLVRKAASIVPREMVANWLYGVAHQTALKARATIAKRHGREKQVAAIPESAREQALWDDLRPMLDRELSRLPDKYRAVIVLCDLEGKTRKEAARHLGMPEGTVATRLTAARNMLARRWARSGLALSGGGFAMLLGSQASSAQVPTALASATIKTASVFAAGKAGIASLKSVALAERMLTTMLMSKLKFVSTAALTIVVLATLSIVVATRNVPGSPVAWASWGAEPPIENGVSDEKPALQEKPLPEPAPPAPPKKGAEPAPTHVSGIVKAVEAGKITVTHGDRETQFRVAGNADIQIDGKPGELARIPVGASIQLRRFVDAGTAGSVLAEGRWFWGIVKSVDVAGSTITYGDNAPTGAAGRTFVVPKDLPISIDGKPGNLEAIPPGAAANVQLMADQTTIRCLAAEGKQVNGIVKSVDAANRRISINDTTYSVAKDAFVSIDRKPGKLEELPAGAEICANLQTDQTTVLRLAANGASIFGQVKAVDAVQRTITVAGGPSDDRVYDVPEDAPIAIDGQPGVLAAIPAGAGLHALNLRVDQKTVSGINVLGPGYHRVPIEAVDVERRTITLGDKAPVSIAGKMIAVAADAHIEIDGKPGRFADIPAGAFASLGLSVDSLTVRNLQAEGPSLGDCGGSEVCAVDPGAGTITFDPKGPAAVAGKMFRVAKDALVQIDGRSGKLAEVSAGSCLNITLTVDQQTVRSIWAMGPPVPGIGVVKAVDAKTRSITVDDRTYPVATNANIILDNRGGLAAVPVGATVSLRLCVDQKTLGTINVLTK